MSSVRKWDTENSWDCERTRKTDLYFLAFSTQLEKAQLVHLVKLLVCLKKYRFVLIYLHWSPKLSRALSLSAALCQASIPLLLSWCPLVSWTQMILRGSVQCQPKHTRWSVLFMSEIPRAAGTLSARARVQPERKRKREQWPGSGARKWEESEKEKQRKRTQTGWWHLVHLSVTLNKERRAFPHGTDARVSLSLPRMKGKIVRGGVDEGLSLTKGWEGLEGGGGEGGRGKRKAFGNTWECLKGGKPEWQRRHKRAIGLKTCQAFRGQCNQQSNTIVPNRTTQNPTYGFLKKQEQIWKRLIVLCYLFILGFVEFLWAIKENSRFTMQM